MLLVPLGSVMKCLLIKRLLANPNSLPAIPSADLSPILRGSLEHSHVMRVRVNRLGALVLLTMLLPRGNIDISKAETLLKPSDSNTQPHTIRT